MLETLGNYKITIQVCIFLLLTVHAMFSEGMNVEILGKSDGRLGQSSNGLL